MAKRNKEKTYWPHMILGFLILGLTLSYWTVKSASSLPVQESNEYMLKYQIADMTINDIIRSKMAFDKEYEIVIQDVETMVMTDNVNSNVPQPNPVKLKKGVNNFNYQVVKKDGTVVSDANVTFLLTRPHSVREDKYVENIPFDSDKFHVKDISIEKPGRYTLQLRAKIGNMTGYSQISAYLKP
jgi:hypothetical protein